MPRAGQGGRRFDPARGTSFSSYAVPCIAVTGRHATAAELARDADVDVEAVLEAREARRALYSALTRVVDRTALESVLALLDERERAVLDLYYRKELSPSEIGRRLGYSQMHISRLIRAAVAHLEEITRPD